MQRKKQTYVEEKSTLPVAQNAVIGYIKIKSGKTWIKASFILPTPKEATACINDILSLSVGV